MITVSSLSKTYGEQVLFEDVTLQLNAGERYGIVGANGSGKSTFLRILAGVETPTSGDVSMAKRARVGVLEQDQFLSDQQSILEVAMMGDRVVHGAMVEKDELLARPAEEFDPDRYAELEDLILQHDGYSLEARAGEVLEGLGIPTAVHHDPLGTLSGGFKLRVLLAQVLAAMPDVLLLDEPTNHLDILSVRWLEKFLCSFPGCVAVVSHDHRFLDNVCTRIIDVDYQRLTPYKGNYSDFDRRKQEHRDRMEAEIAKREAEIAHHQAFIDRFKAKATKARQASSKKKLLERITIERLPQSSRRYPKFRFKECRPSGRTPLEIRHVSKAFGDNRVLDDVSLTVQRGDRVAIIGPNGIGKSTLLKIAVGDLEADSGTCSWGYETHPGYFAQDHRTALTDPKATVLSWLWEACPGQPASWVRGLLGAVLFESEDVDKPVTKLSGGEAARLVFARFAVLEPNVLVLDEPTNHLDLEAIEALVAALLAYDGTVVFVSHDRWFVSQLATRVVEITHEGITDFPGTYDEYLDHLGDDHLDADVALQKAKQRRTAPAGEPQATAREAAQGDGGRDGRRRRRRSDEGRRKKLSARLDRLAREIETAEARVKEIEQRFCTPGFFQNSGPDEVRSLEREQRELRSRSESLMEEWARVEEELSS